MRTPSETTRDENPKPYAGLDASGQWVRSEFPVQSACQSFAERAIAAINRDLIAPATCLIVLKREPVEVQHAFSIATVQSWMTLDAFSDWPHAYSSGSLPRIIQHMGRKAPIWLADENAWAALCDKAEERHKLLSRFDRAKAHALSLAEFLPTVL